VSAKVSGCDAGVVLREHVFWQPRLVGALCGIHVHLCQRHDSKHDVDLCLRCSDCLCMQLLSCANDSVAAATCLQDGVQVDAPYTSVTVPGRKLKDVSVGAPYTSVDVSVSTSLRHGNAAALARRRCVSEYCVRTLAPGLVYTSRNMFRQQGVIDALWQIHLSRCQCRDGGGVYLWARHSRSNAARPTSLCCCHCCCCCFVHRAEGCKLMRLTQALRCLAAS
jgi:hypothetical protein